MIVAIAILSWAFVGFGALVITRDTFKPGERRLAFAACALWPASLVVLLAVLAVIGLEELL